MPRRSKFNMNFRPGAYFVESGAPAGRNEPEVEIARFGFKYGVIQKARLLARRSTKASATRSD
jgi:hypothetical protein